MQIIECVPNISEGRDASIIKEIAEAFSSSPNVHVLHVDSNASANRTVITLAGEAESMLKSAFNGIKRASELIDMQRHKGTHPRIGAVDVCPFIPLYNIDVAETVKRVKILSQRLADELNLPVYNYELAAENPQRKSLANIRKGKYELLPQKLNSPDWKPDFGPTVFNPEFGVATLGVRKLMLAYNINLNASLGIAKQMAGKIRETGYVNKQGIRIDGFFRGVKAIGWYLEDIDKVQVSTNIMDLDLIKPLMVFNKVKELAKEHNANVTGSEIVGMAPVKALIPHNEEFSVNTLLESAIQELGLNEVYKFNANEKILDFKLQELKLLGAKEILG